MSKRKRANLTDLLNNLTYKVIFDKFKLTALNLFKWDGLPDGIDEKYIEQRLFSDGATIFFRDPTMNYMCLQADPGAHLNVYGEPLGWWATGFNYHEYYKSDDCVIISNNKLRIATEQFIIFYVNKLAEAERTMDVNIKSCKTPFVFVCDENKLLSVKRMFDRVDNNEPAIYADSGLNMDTVNVFQTGVRFMGNELQDYKRGVESDLLTFLGVNNIPIDKKERLITDEAESNDELIQSFSDIQLEAREKACEEINKKYGLNISVSLRCGNVKKAVEKEEAENEQFNNDNNNE